VLLSKTRCLTTPWLRSRGAREQMRAALRGSGRHERGCTSSRLCVRVCVCAHMCVGHNGHRHVSASRERVTALLRKGQWDAACLCLAACSSRPMLAHQHLAAPFSRRQSPHTTPCIFSTNASTQESQRASDRGRWVQAGENRSHTYIQTYKHTYIHTFIVKCVSEERIGQRCEACIEVGGARKSHQQNCICRTHARARASSGPQGQ